MKPRSLSLLVLLFAGLVLPLAAQTKLPAAARVAYINSDTLVDETNGIKKLVRVLKDLEHQFQAQQKELMDMTNRLNTLGAELTQLRANPPADPKIAAGKMAEAQQLQQTIKQKGAQAQAAYNKRTKELRAPIEAEISQELPGFIKDRGIDVLLDAGGSGGPILAIRPELDATADFVAYFNAKHP